MSAWLSTTSNEPITSRSRSNGVLMEVADSTEYNLDNFPIMWAQPLVLQLH